MLFGIDVPDRRPDARVRICDYNLLTSADLSRGAPRGEHGPDDPEIAAATLSKYGPEPKAALTVTAANILFESIEPDMRDVLQLVGIASDAKPLGDVMRIAAWAGLLLEAYSAQPALLVAAFRARAIQRGALEPWVPWVDDTALTDTRKGIEYGSRASDWQSERGMQSKELNIADGLMHDVVAPVSVADTDADASNSLLVDDVISRFVVHLLHGHIDSGLARITRSGTGEPTIDTVTTQVGFLNAFTDTNLQVFTQITPVGGDEVAVLDTTKSEHWERLLPRVPSHFEMAGLSEAARAETVRLLLVLFRLIRNMRESFPDEARFEARRRVAELNDLTATVIGDATFLAHRVRTAYLTMTLSDLRGRVPERWDRHEDALDAGAELLTAYRVTKEAYRPTLSPGDWLTFVDSTAPSLSAYARDLGDQTSTAARDAVHNELLEDWSSAFAGIGIDIARIGNAQLLQVGEGLATPLHNWSALAMRDSSQKWYARGLEVALNVVLPLRKKMAERRRNDRSYRFTIQVLTRGLCDTLPNLTHEQRSKQLTRLVELGNALLETSRAKELLQADSVWNSSDVNTAIAIARIGIVQHEHGATTGSRINADVVDRMIVGSLHKLMDDAGGKEPQPHERLTVLRGLESRWQVRRNTHDDHT